MSDYDIALKIQKLAPTAGFSVKPIGSHPDDACDVFERSGYAVYWNKANQVSCPTQEQIDATTVNATALEAITALELEQVRKITPRGDREFRKGIYEALATLPGMSGLLLTPAYLALKAIDDQIKALRAQL